jgi:signal peptidase I
MSLLITSNTPDTLISNYDEQQGINKSFSYTNHLNDTFKIPANSEVAVQSVKINRSGNININEANSIYSFYFGEEIDVDGSYNFVQSAPVQSAFALSKADQQFSRLIANRGPKIIDYTGNVDNIARMMKASLNRNLWHPNLLLNASTGRNPGANVVPLRNGSGLDWLGWKIEITNTDETKNASNISASWMGARYNGTAVGDNYTYNPSTRILTPPVGSLSSCVGIDYPLSLANGSFSCSLVNRHGVGVQRIGLCRSLKNLPPNYFDDVDGDNFYDYLVEIEDNGDIILLHTLPDGLDYNQAELTLTEVNYGTKINASVSLIDLIKFNIKNERVKVSVVDDKGVETVLTDGTGVSASNLKPTGMTTRFLYPKIQIEPGNTIKIEEFFGVDIVNHKYWGWDNFNRNDPGDCSFTDYWAFLQHGLYVPGSENLVKLLDMDLDKIFDRDNLLGLNANKQCDYKVQFFFAPDDRYLNTDKCNSQYLMGFPNRSLVNVPNSTAVTSPFTQTYQSDTAPEMKSTQSLFVRLKNFTHTSVNLAKGSNSKILYHLPAFSNTGQRVGALYFEPNEKTYLKLNNPQDIYLSNIDVDIVYSDETLATDLQGKTTVLFHIRDAKI